MKRREDWLVWGLCWLGALPSVTIAGDNTVHFPTISECRALTTGPRRESFGRGFQFICRAIGMLADRFPKAAFVYLVH